MTRYRRVMTFAILACLGCQQRLPSADVIAQIESRQYRYDEFKTYMEESAFDPDAVLDSKVLSALLDQMLDERLLWQLAGDTLPEGSVVGGRADTEQLLVDSVLEPVGEPEIAQYYRLHREQFQRPERVYIRQVLLDDQLAASDLRQLWAWGAPYEEVIARVDETPGAYLGQEGEFSRQELPSSFADLLFSLEAGTVSDVLTTDYGFHVIRVVAHQAPSEVDFRSAKSEIRRELEQKRIHDGLEKLVESARERYNVSVFVRNVPFNYEGIHEQQIYQTSD